MTLEWMDDKDIWYKDHMPGQILGAAADAFNHKGPINTWQQIDNSGHCCNIRVWDPWPRGMLNLSYKSE